MHIVWWQIISIIGLGDQSVKEAAERIQAAIGVLCQNGDIGVKNLAEYGFVGELSLDGRELTVKYKL